jgi:hypothetical protein
VHKAVAVLEAEAAAEQAPQPTAPITLAQAEDSTAAVTMVDLVARGTVHAPVAPAAALTEELLDLAEL